MPTVVVIDDEDIVRESMAMLLEAGGWTTILAESGFAGLDKARKSIPDLILCDITMPRMDGLTTLTEIRRDPVLKRTPVLMVTGRPDASADQALAMGAQGVLLKPFRLGELLGAAERALDANGPSPPPSGGD